MDRPESFAFFANDCTICINSCRFDVVIDVDDDGDDFNARNVGNNGRFINDDDDDDDASNPWNEE